MTVGIRWPDLRAATPRPTASSAEGARQPGFLSLVGGSGGLGLSTLNPGPEATLGPQRPDREVHWRQGPMAGGPAPSQRTSEEKAQL